MRSLPVIALLTAKLLASTSPVHAEAVGSAAAVRNDVRGTVAGPMRTGSPVQQNETVSAGADLSAQLLFRDKSNLTLGPGSRVTIDKFVYDPSKNTGESALRLAKGALRFVSGSQTPEKYSVRTPLATMGVRGSSPRPSLANSVTSSLSSSKGRSKSVPARAVNRLQHRDSILSCSRTARWRRRHRGLAPCWISPPRWPSSRSTSRRS